MVGMVKDRRPEEGVVVMAEVRSVRENQAIVHLLEYDLCATVKLDTPLVHHDAVGCRVNPAVVGRIEPMVVVAPIISVVLGGFRKAAWHKWMRNVSVFRSFRSFRFFLRRKSIVAASRDVSVNDLYSCEATFARRKHVREILFAVSTRTGQSLARIYSLLGWPQDLQSLEGIAASPIESDLVNGLKFYLSFMNHRFFWTIEGPYLLAPAWPYPIGWCWAVSLTRQFEALLKKAGILPAHVFLSVQDLMNGTPDGDKDADGTIEGLEYGERALLEGITTVEFCSLGCTQRREGGPVFRIKKMSVVYDSAFTDEVWDKMIVDQCSVGPFAASVIWFNSYRGRNASDQMFGPNAEEKREYAADPSFPDSDVHTMLLSGLAVDKDGRSFVQFQDTTRGDLDNGDRGFLRFARYDPCPVIELVQMELLPISEYPIL